MDNPFKPPKADLWQELPEQPENPCYRYANYAYAGIAFVILGFVVAAGNWSSIADLVLTIYLLLPCATSASMLWAGKRLQSVVIGMHLFAIVGLVAYGAFLVANNEPPPLVVVVFSSWSLFILVWSIRLFKNRSNNSLNPDVRHQPRAG